MANELHDKDKFNKAMNDLTEFIEKEVKEATEKYEAHIKELEARQAQTPRKLVFRQSEHDKNLRSAHFHLFGEWRQYDIYKDGKRHLWHLHDCKPFMEFITCNDYADGEAQAQAHFEKELLKHFEQ